MTDTLKDIREALTSGEISAAELSSRSGVSLRSVFYIAANPNWNPRLSTAQSLAWALEDFRKDRGPRRVVEELEEERLRPVPPREVPS